MDGSESFRSEISGKPSTKMLAMKRKERNRENMLTCAILDDYQGVALVMANWGLLENRVKARIYREHFAQSDALVEAIADCEIVAIMRERTRFDRGLFERLPKLKLLVTTGMKNAAIDLEAAKDHGITVLGTDGGSRATTELTWALLLGLARSIVPENQGLRANGPWQTFVGVDLHTKHLGIVGLGRIGSQVAEIGRAFGMEVSAWSQNLTRERTDALGIALAPSLPALLAQSDFVTIHVVLSERTRGLIGPSELSLMKPTAYLINTSRGPIVNEAALKAALTSGTIAGAGLDVFGVEPLPPDDAFRSLPNVLATPHIGYVSQDTYRRWYAQVVEDIATYLDGHPVRALV